MDHTQNKQNIRRPASQRATQVQKHNSAQRPVQHKGRTTPSPRQPAKQMIRQPQFGNRPPAIKRNPTLQKNVPRSRVKATTGRSVPAKLKQKTVSRNFFLAVVFAALILVTIIIGGVQSCAADKKTDGAVTTALPKLVNQEENADVAGSSNDSALPTLAVFTDDTEELVIDSEYGILIDLSDNTVVASKNGDSRIYPASMTKIMTLIVAYEHIEDLDATYTFPAEIFDSLYQANASVAGFQPGETVPYRDLFYGTALPSGADATTALALTVAGSESAFAKLMNETADRLGLENTHFVNASGLHDDNHYTTCREMALILEYAISFSELRQVLSTYKYTTTATEQNPQGLELYNTLYTKMEGSEAEGMYVQGGKTGYTVEARHCLATFAAPCTEENAPYTRPRFILVTAYGMSEYKPIFDAINTYAAYKP